MRKKGYSKGELDFLEQIFFVSIHLQGYKIERKGLDLGFPLQTFGLYNETKLRLKIEPATIKVSQNCCFDKNGNIKGMRSSFTKKENGEL